MIQKLSPLKTVGELREALAQFTAETPISGTWEGQVDQGVYVYLAADGTVMVDEDECRYMARLQELKCGSCSKQAVNIINGKPTCWEHWPKPADDNT